MPKSSMWSQGKQRTQPEDKTYFEVYHIFHIKWKRQLYIILEKSKIFDKTSKKKKKRHRYTVVG